MDTKSGYISYMSGVGCGEMDTSDPSVAGGSVDTGNSSGEDQSKFGAKLCIPCEPVVPQKGTQEGGPSTVHSHQELEVTQVLTKGGDQMRKGQRIPRAEIYTVIKSDKPDL